MIAGQLTEIIEVHRPITTINEYGEQSVHYSLIYTTKARLLHNSGNRELVNSEIFYGYVKTFFVRDYIQVGDFDWIKWNGKFYKILSITPNKQRMELEIKCELINE